jgi:hypothetical protein
VFEPWALLSGFLFTISTANAFMAIATVGLSVGSGVWCGTAVLVSFVWGVFVQQETVANLPLAVSQPHPTLSCHIILSHTPPSLTYAWLPYNLASRLLHWLSFLRASQVSQRQATFHPRAWPAQVPCFEVSKWQELVAYGCSAVAWSAFTLGCSLACRRRGGEEGSMDSDVPLLGNAPAGREVG